MNDLGPTSDPLIIELDHCDWYVLNPHGSEDRDEICRLLDRSLESARYVFNEASETWMGNAFWTHYVKWCVSKILLESKSGKSSTVYYVDKMTNKALAKVKFMLTNAGIQTAIVWEPRSKHQTKTR